MTSESQTGSERPEARTRQFRDVAMLDLRYIKSADELADVRAIRDVGMILISESMQGALAKIDLQDVGGIVAVPDGDGVFMLSGQSTLTGEAMAAGDPNATLVIAGQLFIITPVTSVGYKEIRVYGQLFAAKGSEAAILPKITHLAGQNFFIPANPRFFKGSTELNQEFFELLTEPQPFVVMGKLSIASDVTKEMLQAKVPEIMLMGKIEAPRRLLPLLEFLTREKMGKIDSND